MSMMKAVFRRFLTVLVCLTLCFSAAGAEDVSVILKPDADTWTNGEAFTFSGEVRHPGTDLSESILQAAIKTDPDEGDKGLLVFTSINGVDEDPDWWDCELWLGEYETNGDLLRFTGTWTAPEGSKFNKAKLTIYVIQGDGTKSTASCEMENAHPVISIYGMSVPQLALILAAVIAAVVGIWFLLNRKKDRPEELTEGKKSGRVLDTVIIAMFFLGVILTPVYVRAPILLKLLRPIRDLRYLNVPCMVAVLLSFLRLKKWTKVDLACFAAWVLLLIPMFVSNREFNIYRFVLTPLMALFPIVLVFFRMDGKSREKTIRLFMILFNTFIILLLAFAIEERITGKAGVRALVGWMNSQGMDAKTLENVLDDPRFLSFWGHPLTNTLLFVSFMTLNTAWYKSRGKKIYALLYYPFGLAGVLLSGSKTGIALCAIILVIILWEHKKWFLLCIPVLAGLYFAGAFNSIIYRFTNTSLTTGRLEALELYFGKLYTDYPFQWLSGYGSGVVYVKGHPLVAARAGFEFPLLMHALDHGIIFALVLMAGSYLYVTWRCLSKRQWTIWLCYTAVFADLNTYNGYAFRSHDIFLINCFLTMIFLNMLPDKAPEKKAVPEAAPEPAAEAEPEPAAEAISETATEAVPETTAEAKEETVPETEAPEEQA